MPRSEDGCVICADLSVGESASYHKSPQKISETLLAVSPFLAILSAPTTEEKRQVMLA